MTLGRRSFCLSKHHHPSRQEADYCNWLLARKQNKEIIDYKYIYDVPLRIEGRPWKSWAADFGVTELDGTTSIHECKGYNRSDELFKLKLSIFFMNYPATKVYVNMRLVTPYDSGRICIRAPKKRAWPKRLFKDQGRRLGDKKI